MEIFEISKTLPMEDYSLTAQIRRSSRSVSGNIGEAFRNRRYPKSFIAKLSDAEGETVETQLWLQYAFGGSYISRKINIALDEKYNHIIGKFVNMIIEPEKWSWWFSIHSFFSLKSLSLSNVPLHTQPNIAGRAPAARL